MTSPRGQVGRWWERAIVGRVDTEYVESNWFTLLVAGAAVIVGGGTLFTFAADPFFVNKDSALFQHGGWYILNGGTLYVDVWDLKPPLIYGLTAVLAALSFGNMAVLHVLSVAVAVGALVWGIVAVGLVTHRLTDDGVASLTAAGAVLIVPAIYVFPYAGIRPKYLAFACGATAVLFAVDDRDAPSGAAAAVAAGFWQPAGAFTILVAAMGFDRSGWRGLARTVGGGLAVAAIVVLPFVLTGTAVAMLVETVIAPLYAVERYTVPGRVLAFVHEFGYGVLVVGLGVYGGLRATADAPREYWWVSAGAVLFGLQVFLDLQGAIDAILLLPFVGVGVGLVVAKGLIPARRSVVVALVVVLVLGNVYWAKGPVTPVKDRVEDVQDEYHVSAYPTLPPDPPGVPSMQTIYWEKQKPELCHYRLGHKQKYFMHVTGGSLTKQKCGQWPFDQPPLQWLGDQLVPG